MHVRTAPENRLRLAVLLGLALCAASFAGCTASWSSDQGKKISPKGSAYSYRVPHGWLIDHGDVSFADNGRVFKSAVRGQDGIAAIIVSQQEIGVEIASSNLRNVESEFERDAAVWQDPASGFRKITLAGAPALEYQVTGAQTSEGNPENITGHVAFKGQRAFFVSCISTDETRSEAAHACDKVMRSLMLY